MADFNKSVNYVLNIEDPAGKGIVSEDPTDKGGITRFGISFRFLKSVDKSILKDCAIYSDPVSENDIKNLTLTKAKQLYFCCFWKQSNFDKIFNQSICDYLFSTSINMNISPAIKCLQRAIWSLKRNRQVFPDDGILGDETLAIVNRNYTLLLPILRSEVAGRYRLIVDAHSDQKDHLNGWLTRAYEK